MKRLPSFLLLCVWASAVIADPVLIGRWVSDREASATFNEKYAQLEPKTAAFLRDSMGRLVVDFGAHEVSYRLPNWESTIEGKRFPITGFTETHPYRVVASTATTVAIETVQPVSHETVIVVYNFVAPDKTWIYVSIPDSHLREYFTRDHQHQD